MKQIYLYVFCILPALLYAQQKSDTVYGLRFNCRYFDFGNIKEGPCADHQFWFTNITKHPITITNVLSPDPHYADHWPQKPILPGKSEYINIHMPTAGRAYPFKHRCVRVMVGAVDSSFDLCISGNIVLDSTNDKRSNIPNLLLNH